MSRADFYTAIVLMAFGIAASVLALQMPPVTERGQSPYTAPGLLPTFLGIVIASLSFIMFVRSVRHIGRDVLPPEGAVKRFFGETGTRRMGITIFLCVLYSISLGSIYFPLTSFLFVFIFVLVFEYRLKEPFRTQIKKVLLAALLALCASAGITGLFQYLFLVNLP